MMRQDKADELELGARLMAEHYPHLTVTDLEVIQGGGIKTVWKIDASRGLYCLKRLGKPLPYVEAVTAAQLHLRRNGACVADIVRTKEDGLYSIHGGYAFVLYSWIDGSDLYMDEIPDLYTGLRGLARFHQASSGFDPPDGSRMVDRMGEWPRHYRKLRSELALWRGEAKRETSAFHQSYLETAGGMITMADQAILALERSCYSEWVRAAGPYGPLCHQDYGKGNALLTERGVYVLDLDNVAYDLPVRDTRKVIAKRMERLGRWDSKELERCVACYESVYPLTPAQRQVLLIDLLFPHSYYGYAKRCFKKEQSCEGERLRTIVGMETAKQLLLQPLLTSR
ncbi:Spore coat protein I [Paenibacillus solanacearum]|uniref:Spore coat protein I n=1 Tax=Paenibacillus solanacearum TaxID=2048548 RepID=A0A916NQ96_9BACL|nr:CotS family spore coat protein [Paenibacillus solanacearum]CAG7632113.1 Spore coat protein I [Paenibacillus solanacearum]